MSRHPRTSRDEICRAALELIDDRGVDAVSMGAIAERLGVRAPSLYNHFASKAEIFSEVVRSIVLDAPVPPFDEVRGWQEWLITSSTSLRRTILLHPNAATLIFEHFPRESIAPSYQRSVKHLTEAGISPDRQLVVFEGLDRITLGSALDSALQMSRRTSGTGSPFPGRRTGLAEHGWDEEALFVEVLRTFLRGV